MTDFKIVSFNINGLRARLHQLQALIDKHQPDVIGLQEIKVHDDAFPLEAVEAMGYHVAFHGQKAHYGVALLTKLKPDSIEKGFPNDSAEAQCRMITANLTLANGEKLKVMNGYYPQGESQDHPVKYPYKRQFYADLQEYLNQQTSPDQNLVLIGDMNISPTDLDIGIGEANAKRWLKTGKCSFLPEERAWLQTLLEFGLVDTFRALHPETNDKFSWFDYRSKGFDENRGLRIDLLLATESMAKRCIESDVDYPLRSIEKPSDHAPVWSTFRF